MQVTAVHLNPIHTFSKLAQPEIQLIADQGVQGDAHCGALTQHLYRVRKDPNQPNLCQVHLLQQELLDEIDLAPGQLGENITTRGIELIDLPLGTVLTLGTSAMLEVTGLRTPCSQMDKLRPGLMRACFYQNSESKSVPRAGIMAIVLTGGTVLPNDPIRITLPSRPYRPLPRV